MKDCEHRATLKLAHGVSFAEISQMEKIGKDMDLIASCVRLGDTGRTPKGTLLRFIFLANRCHFVQKVPESGDVQIGA
jgi:hypothetical protein